MVEDGNTDGDDDPGEDGTREEVVRLTQQVVTEGARVTAAFVALHGMHPTDVEALTRVLVAQERGEPLTAGALARALGLTSGSLTAVVDRLERAGYLRRVRDPRDRRKVLLECSPEGRALADRYVEPVRARSHAVMDQFSPAELQVVRRFLATTGQAMAAHRRSLTTQDNRGPAHLGASTAMPAIEATGPVRRAASRRW